MLRTLADPESVPIHWRLTSRFRALPSFLVIGAQRAGTSFLYSVIASHPGIAPALVKEVHYFDNNYQRGLAWYRAHFPSIGIAGLRLPGSPAKITGEASPYYLFHPLAPGRVASILPEARLVAVLRNPVDRAYSHYQKERRKGTEFLPFEEALEAESERVPGEREKLVADPTYRSMAHQRFSYLARGIYVDQIEAWRQWFPEKQLLVLNSEDMFRQPEAAVRSVCDFLELPDWSPSISQEPRATRYTPMSPSARRRLVDHFRPHNARLFQHLGRDFSWDR
jgi:hypothetical protein